MKKPVKPLVDAEAALLLEPESESEPVAEPVAEPGSDAESIEAPKKPRTEKQIAAFAKVLEKRDANRRARAEDRATAQAADKVQLEEKIVKKAVSIKKKQIKRQLALDEISDDDEPLEAIKKKLVARAPRAVPAPPPPQTPSPPRVRIQFV